MYQHKIINTTFLNCLKSSFKAFDCTYAFCTNELSIPIPPFSPDVCTHQWTNHGMDTAKNCSLQQLTQQLPHQATIQVNLDWTNGPLTQMFLAHGQAPVGGKTNCVTLLSFLSVCKWQQQYAKSEKLSIPESKLSHSSYLLWFDNHIAEEEEKLPWYIFKHSWWTWKKRKNIWSKVNNNGDKISGCNWSKQNGKQWQEHELRTINDDHGADGGLCRGPCLCHAHGRGLCALGHGRGHDLDARAHGTCSRRKLFAVRNRPHLVHTATQTGNSQVRKTEQNNVHARWLFLSCINF